MANISWTTKSLLVKVVTACDGWSPLSAKIFQDEKEYSRHKSSHVQVNGICMYLYRGEEDHASQISRWDSDRTSTRVVLP
jgi:hypothetical protein